MELAVRQQWMEELDNYKDYYCSHFSYCTSVWVLYNIKYKQTAIQRQQVILDVIGALDIATTFFVFPMIHTQVHPINSNFMPQSVNFTEEDFRETLISFANAYITLSNITGYESVQAPCLNSFGNLRAVISTSETINEEARID